MAEIGKDINKAKELLDQGKLVAIPTETVYGLAGNALNPEAVARIFQVKERPQFDPLIIHVPSLSRVSLYAENIPQKAIDLALAFWPGPLTLLLERKSNIPDLVTAGLSTVGIRCPDHTTTSLLLGLLNFPLAAPSANPFGYVSPTTPQHVNDQLGEKISYILDGGPCRIGIESTIVGFDRGTGTIYRSGGLSGDDIERVIGKVEFQVYGSSNPKTPGQLESHYSPQKKILVGDLKELIDRFSEKRIGILSFRRDFGMRHQFVLSPSGNLEEAAQRFFYGLRELDKLPIELILAEYVPDTGMGKAINDRLRRASFRSSGN